MTKVRLDIQAGLFVYTRNSTILAQVVLETSQDEPGTEIERS